jgi:hypothetical protein
MRGGLTQTDCYRILGMRKAKGWTSAIRGSISLDESIVRWKIDTGWKEIEF